jgi:hypothetical protein
MVKIVVNVYVELLIILMSLTPYESIYDWIIILSTCPFPVHSVGLI